MTQSEQTGTHTEVDVKEEVRLGVKRGENDLDPPQESNFTD